MKRCRQAKPTALDNATCVLCTRTGKKYSIRGAEIAALMENPSI
jgi:hypothetical protein